MAKSDHRMCGQPPFSGHEDGVSLMRFYVQPEKQNADKWKTHTRVLSSLYPQSSDGRLADRAGRSSLQPWVDALQEPKNI
nr:hypothetical protein Itr_chr14CG24370 [Ipomoea trifida]